MDLFIYFDLTKNYLEELVCTVSISSYFDRNNVNHIVSDRANQGLFDTMRMSNSGCFCGKIDCTKIFKLKCTKLTYILKLNFLK